MKTPFANTKKHQFLGGKLLLWGLSLVLSLTALGAAAQPDERPLHHPNGWAPAVAVQQQDSEEENVEDVEGAYEDVEGAYEDVEGAYEDVEGAYEEEEPTGDGVDSNGSNEQSDNPQEPPADPSAVEGSLEQPAPIDDGEPSVPQNGEDVDGSAAADSSIAAPVGAPTLDETGDSTESEDSTNMISQLFRFGDPIPLTLREPTVSQFTLEVDLHYGLVGSGPTRFTNDVRFGLFDWWELRTSFTPYPSSLISRFRIGSQQGALGAFLIDGGLASIDAGLRLEQGLDQKLDIGARFHFEVGIAYAKSFAKRFSFYTMARYRYRYSQLDDEGSVDVGNFSLPIPTNRRIFEAGKTDEQNAASVEAHLAYDVLPNLGVSGGIGYAEVIGTPVRELSVNFVAVDRPGMSHFLLRNDGWSRSLTFPMAVTYGFVDTFDVDVFFTPRIWPQLDVIFGAGLRWRI
jgi:hypothetical protein